MIPSKGTGTGASQGRGCIQITPASSTGMENGTQGHGAGGHGRSSNCSTTRKILWGEILSRGETMREGRDDGKGGGLANAMALPGKKIKKSKVQQRPCQVLQLKEEIVHNVI